MDPEENIFSVFTFPECRVCFSYFFLQDLGGF